MWNLWPQKKTFEEMGTKHVFDLLFQQELQAPFEEDIIIGTTDQCMKL